jgi:hypothetical protein
MVACVKEGGSSHHQSQSRSQTRRIRPRRLQPRIRGKTFWKGIGRTAGNVVLRDARLGLGLPYERADFSVLRREYI